MTKQYLKLPYTLIKIEGPDAARFLQGQVSCNIDTLTEGTWTYGTANTAKGRMYWLFVIARIGDTFWIRVHEDIADSGIQVLNKYKVFFKCDIIKASEYTVYGLSEAYTEDARAVSEETLGYLRAADNVKSRTELWSMQDLESSVSVDEQQAWFQEDCRNGIPEIYPETLDTFILQQLNLQELGAVSFNKGCYTGQEIIARMKFLGKLKKKMYRFSSAQDLDCALTPGGHIFDSEGKKLGQIVRAHVDNGTLEGLAVCDIAYATDGKPAFLSAEGTAPIDLKELHYNLVE